MKVSQAMKEIKGTPEKREEQKAKATAYWQDPEYRAKKSRKVSIQGVIYDSIVEAAKALGLYTSIVRQRLNSKTERTKDWFYV